MFVVGVEECGAANDEDDDGEEATTVAVAAVAASAVAELISELFSLTAAPLHLLDSLNQKIIDLLPMLIPD